MIATLDDLDRALFFAHAFCTSLPRKIKYCEDSARHTLKTLIEHEQGVLFISEKGFLGASLQPLLFNHDYVQAVENFWYGDRALFKEFQEWAQGKAQAVIMGSIHGLRHETIGKIYERAGFSPTEHFYVRDL